MKYYLAVKRNKVLIKLEENVLSERSQSRKIYLYDAICMKCPEQANLWRQKADPWLPRAGGGWEKMRVNASGFGVMNTF